MHMQVIKGIKAERNVAIFGFVMSQEHYKSIVPFALSLQQTLKPDPVLSSNNCFNFYLFCPIAHKNTLEHFTIDFHIFAHSFNLFMKYGYIRPFDFKSSGEVYPTTKTVLPIKIEKRNIYYVLLKLFICFFVLLSLRSFKVCLYDI